MSCPDELTLDLWLAEALPAEEAAIIAAHVRTCATCAAALRSAQALDAGLHAALALDAGERAYLSSLDLAARWRPEPSTAPAWGWIALLGAVGGYLAWLAIAPLVGAVALPAAGLALGTLPLYLAFDALFALGQLLVEVIRHPALGLTQPLLALLALALLLLGPRQLMPQRSTAA
jgi:anti-sigma factor RsiW